MPVWTLATLWDTTISINGATIQICPCTGGRNIKESIQSKTKMSSYGIVGVNPDSLKVIRDMQQFKNVHVCDKYKTKLTPFKNAQVHQTIADFSLNMPTPRTIATFVNPDDYEHERTMDQLIEWCDKEDTIVNMNMENFKTSELHAEKCKDKGIHYMAGGVSDKLLIIDGPKDIVDAQEIFFRTFAKKLTHVGEDPGSGHL